jgi:hypothetical protein
LLFAAYARLPKCKGFCYGQWKKILTTPLPRAPTSFKVFSDKRSQVFPVVVNKDVNRFSPVRNLSVTPRADIKSGEKFIIIAKL